VIYFLSLHHRSFIAVSIVSLFLFTIGSIISIIFFVFSMVSFGQQSARPAQIGAYTACVNNWTNIYQPNMNSTTFKITSQMGLQYNLALKTDPNPPLSNPLNGESWPSYADLYYDNPTFTFFPINNLNPSLQQGQIVDMITVTATNVNINQSFSFPINYLTFQKLNPCQRPDCLDCPLGFYNSFCYNFNAIQDLTFGWDTQVVTAQPFYSSITGGDVTGLAEIYSTNDPYFCLFAMTGGSFYFDSPQSSYTVNAVILLIISLLLGFFTSLVILSLFSTMFMVYLRFMRARMIQKTFDQHDVNKFQTSTTGTNNQAAIPDDNLTITNDDN